MRTKLLDENRTARPVWVVVVLFGIILAAAVLRLWQLNVLPPGLFYDEAFNGLDARKVLAGGYHPIYFTGNNGREPLFIYLQTLSVWLLGATPFALRLVSALLGILTVPVIYFTARTVLGAYPLGQRPPIDSAALSYLAALAATAGMTVSYWHLSISRLGFRAMMLPLVSALALAFFWRAWTKGRAKDYAWSGVWFAASLYTYVAARLLPLVVVAFVLLEASMDLWRLRQNRLPLWRPWRPRLIGLALMALVGSFLVAPLVWEFLTNPTLLSARTADISVFTVSQADMPGTPLQRIIHNAGATVGSFYVGGDRNARHNLPNRPVNDLLLAILFTVGWLAALIRIKIPHARLILLWLGVMLAPVVLSTEAPHTLRGTGALPAVALLYGLGTYTLALVVAWAGLRFHRPSSSTSAGEHGAASRDSARLASALGFILLAAILVGSGTTTVRDYFGKWAHSPDLGDAFSLSNQLAASETARLLAAPSQPGVLLPSGLYYTPQMGFAVGPILEGDLPQALAASSKARPPIYRLDEVDPTFAAKSYYLVWSEAGQPRSAWVKMDDETQSQPLTRQPDATPLRSPIQQPDWPQVISAVLPANAGLQMKAIDYPLHVDFENGLTLAGYDVEPGVVKPGDAQTPLYLTLFWRRTQAAETGANPAEWSQSSSDQGVNVNAFDVFVHLSNDEGVWKTNNGPIIGGHFLNSSPTAVLDEVRKFEVPSDMTPGKAFFEVGLYEYNAAHAAMDQNRLSVVNDQGEPVADSATLGALWVGTQPPEADFTDLTPLGIQFDGQIELAGFSVQPQPEDPSQLEVILGWRSLGRPASDFTAFVHLIDQSGSILSQFDQPPAGVNSPSHLWTPDESARSGFPITMPADQNTAQTALRIGLYEPVSGRQLPITALPNNSFGAIGDTYAVVPLPE